MTITSNYSTTFQPPGSTKGLNEAPANFERLSVSTAQRVVSFRQVRPAKIA